jgi:hypothetical protein
MSDKCTCFEDKLNEITKELESNMPQGAQQLDVQWADSVFFIGGDYSRVNPQIKYEFKKKKTNGELAKSFTKDKVSLVADYCCYCGRKLGKSDNK